MRSKQPDDYPMRKVSEAHISVPKASLLKVIRKLDLNAPMSTQDFAAEFDDLRAAFTPDEVATGKLR